MAVLRVALVGAVNGRRYSLPGVGEADNWTIPVAAFEVKDVIGRRLILLHEPDARGVLCLARGSAPGYEFVLSPGCVTAILSQDGEVRTCGLLAPLADERFEIRVLFGDRPLQEPSAPRPCADLEAVLTPRSDCDDGGLRFRC